MKHEEHPLVIVLSRNYSTGLSVIRSLGAAGYKVDLVASVHKKGASKVVAASKYVHKAVEVVSKKVKDGPDKELLNELLKYEDKQHVNKLVLFPTDDYTTSVIDNNRVILEEIFIMPSIGGSGLITEYMDKTVQSKAARDAGLFTPVEWKISLEKEFCIPEDIIYPCFCKPLVSIMGYKTEMAVCNNEEELKQHLYRLREKFTKRSVVVQEFLEIDSEIGISGVCLDQNIIIPAINKKIKVSQHEKGMAITGTIAPFQEFGAMKENIVKLLKAFHYTGMFDMEFNVVGDKIYFNEVNLRSGGLNYTYFKSGVNLPEIFVKEILGKRHDPKEEVIKEYGKIFVRETIAWEEYIHGFIKKEELKKYILEADITIIHDKDDFEPGKVFGEEMERTVKKNERKDRIKRQKEECIKSTMELTGCDRMTAEEQIKDARRRIGISYNDYKKFEFYHIPIEEQAHKYAQIIAKRERRKRQREECIISAMELTDWEREFAEQQIKDARNRLGISYNDYKKFEFALIPVEKQQEKYDVIVSEKGKKSSAKQ